MEIKKFVNKEGLKYNYMEDVVAKGYQKTRFILKKFQKLNLTPEVRAFVEKVSLLQKEGYEIAIINDRSWFEYSLFLHTDTKVSDLIEAEEHLLKEGGLCISIMPTTFSRWIMSCDSYFDESAGYFIHWSSYELAKFKPSKNTKNTNLTYNLGTEFGDLLKKAL